MKYVKIVIYSLELRKIYNNPFKIKQSHKIFLSIFEDIKDHLDEDILIAVKPPKLQGKEKEDNPISPWIYIMESHTCVLKNTIRSWMMGWRLCWTLAKNMGVST